MVPLTNDLLDLVYQINNKRGEICTMDDLTKFRMNWVEKECYKPGLILMEDKLWQRISLAKPAKVLALGLRIPFFIATSYRTQICPFLNGTYLPGILGHF